MLVDFLAIILNAIFVRCIFVECTQNQSFTGGTAIIQNITVQNNDTGKHPISTMKLRDILVTDKTHAVKNAANGSESTQIPLSSKQSVIGILLAGDTVNSENNSSVNKDNVTLRSFLTATAYHWPGYNVAQPPQYWIGPRANKIRPWLSDGGRHRIRSKYLGESDVHNQPIYVSHMTHLPHTNSDPPIETNSVQQRISDMYNEILLSKHHLLNDNFQWKMPEEEKYVYIPYEIHEIEPEVRHHLEYYLELFHKNSCIRWIKRTYEDDYLVIKASLDEQGELVDRCYSSSVGMKGGVQYVHLTTRCLGLMPGYIPALYNIPHELMHALGFIHEQSRLDRDCYIALTKQGAQDAHANRRFTSVPTDMKFPYDINSVMQYRLSDAYVSLQGETIGPIGEDPSWQDWRKINYLYCGEKHICEDHTALCLRHKAILRKCIRDGRMQKPSDHDYLQYLYGQDNW
ncbi:uncharacterized protein LOC124366554 isoform X2 [Homalodisca vitripennis]|uniref:uncharacterized protein LOC124366554 isoform X2 n=1 Tax=Homalodisca vitripennis TaxID=197043 RepID=UPI001EE9CEF7|nr:uncharacterized protein LOC124366554 isoform X2 [Homalodisca vitripennis]